MTLSLAMNGIGPIAICRGWLFIEKAAQSAQLKEQLFRVDNKQIDSYDPRAELRKLQFDRGLQAGRFGEQGVVTTHRRSRRDGAHCLALPRDAVIARVASGMRRAFRAFARTALPRCRTARPIQNRRQT